MLVMPAFGLGQSSHDLSTDEMLKKSGLDWYVEKLPTYVNAPSGQQKTGSFALVRSSDNKVLAPSGDKTGIQFKQRNDGFLF